MNNADATLTTGFLLHDVHGAFIAPAPSSLQVLLAYLDQLLCPEAVGSSSLQPRPLPGTKGLVLPASSDAADYMSIVDALPDADDPALFGLPANINRATGRRSSSAVIAILKQITASKVLLASTMLP